MIDRPSAGTDTAQRAQRLDPLGGDDLVRRGIPFAVLITATTVIEPVLNDPVDRRVWLAGCVVLAMTTVATLGARAFRPTSLAATAPAAVFMVAVALLRHGGGTSAGYGPLVLLPPVWYGLYGTRWQMRATVAMGALVYAVPILLDGAPRYPATMWRTAMLMAAIGLLAGSAIGRLRDQAADRTEEARTAEGELRSVLESMVDPIGRWQPIRDDRGSIVDFRCVFMNSAAISALQDRSDANLVERLRRTGRESSFAWFVNVAASGRPARHDLPSSNGDDHVFEMQLTAVGGDVLSTWRDVTAARREANELRAAEALWQSVAQASADVSIRLQADGTVRYVSSSVAELLGMEAEWAVGRQVLDAVHEDHRPRVVDAISRAARGERVTVELLTRPRPPAEPQWVEATAQGVDVGGQREVAVAVRNVTAQRRRQSDLEHAARHDPLTSLLNRTGFDEVVDRLLRRPHGIESIFVLYLDLDRFKAINDAYGHHEGDVVLVEVARRIVETVRGVDGIARLGGDEFAVVGLSAADDVGSASLVARLTRSVTAPIQLSNGTYVTVGVSIGRATATDGMSAAQLLHVADREMYLVKGIAR